MRWALVLVPLLLAGCASPEGIGFSGDADAARDPYYKEHREVVSGAHNKTFDVPVEAGATLTNVTIALDARTNGLPLPDSAVAQLDVVLLSAAGEALHGATIDGQHPRASLLVADLPPGLYHVEVKGFGAAPELDDRTYGAGYVLTIEVVYAE